VTVSAYDQTVMGFLRRDGAVVAAVVAGGVIGALARYGLGVAFPRPRGGFPWATFGVNVSGCLLIGALIVLVTEGLAAHPLTRPFLGTGVLGGYTTFSTAMVDTQRLWTAGAAGTGLAYLFGTVAAALVAAHLGVLATRWFVERRRAA
jgi:CrcB protein